MAPSCATGTICSRPPRRPHFAHAKVWPTGACTGVFRVEKYATKTITVPMTQGAYPKK